MSSMTDLTERLRKRIADLRTRLDDIRDDRHFPAHMLSAHDGMVEMLDEFAATTLDALTQENARLREALQWMVDNDDTNEGDTPLADLGGQTWNEVNAYWIAGLNRARKALGGGE